jgi:hypothetical protein
MNGLVATVTTGKFMRVTVQLSFCLRLFACDIRIASLVSAAYATGVPTPTDILLLVTALAG